MLLRFSAENYRSLRDRQELTLVKSSLRDTEEGLLKCEAADEGLVLPAAIIYGANASGKSSVIAALRFIRRAVLLSHSRGEPGSRIPITKFALDSDSQVRPSKFDIDFVIDDVRYHYGFEALESEFHSEWLYTFPSGRKQTLFERTKQDFSFGRGLKGRNKVISDLTRPNSLFLSAAAQNDHDELSKVVRFFRSMAGVNLTSLSAATHSTSEPDGRIIEFLKNIGTGVVGFRNTEEEIPEKMLTFSKELAVLIGKTAGDTAPIDFTREMTKARKKIELSHQGEKGEVFLSLEAESAGTRSLLSLLAPVFECLDKGSLLIVDELNASLHTRACEAIVEMFSSPKTNPRRAQIIATTHDTNLLHSGILRRDQIWFTEKDSVGATHLYPLTDIRTRKGDNIEKGYLQGRFGAIPFSGALQAASS